MQIKNPKIFMIGKTEIDYVELQNMIKELGMQGWNTDSTSGAEVLTEVGGRLCYKSFEPGLNPNVTKIREGNETYIGNVLKQGHGSVLEHGSVTFAFINVTRVLTHELVRHRAGMSYSQESLRYVRLTDLNAYFPEVFMERSCMDIEESKGNDPREGVLNSYKVHQLFRSTVEFLEDIQKELAEIFDIDNIKNFNLKKKLTSAFRRLAPIGLQTNIMVTGNHRAWRHIISMRANEHAEEEVRSVMLQVARIMKIHFPNLYQDMTIDNDRVHFLYDKV